MTSPLDPISAFLHDVSVESDPHIVIEALVRKLSKGDKMRRAGNIVKAN
jgi:hypothetical protein